MIRRLSALIIALAVTTGLLSSTGGAAEKASANLFAVVSQGGELLAGNGVSSVTHTFPGRYEVTFEVDVSGCAYVATTANVYSQAITVFTAGGHDSPNGVYVETKNQGGGLMDGPFSLAVVCGSWGMKYAVVGYEANLVRSTPGTTMRSLGSGRYQLTFPNSVRSCAYVATVADPGSGLVYNPAGVYTGSGPNANTVYMETKNPGGGLQSGVPFHLAVICPWAPAVRTAVVKASGGIQRGSKLTSSFRYATGQYTVVSDRSLRACAPIGTRGSVDEQVPFAPATVEFARGPAPNTIDVQVRELLFFGGQSLDESFHTVIVC